MGGKAIPEILEPVRCPHLLAVERVFNRKALPPAPEKSPPFAIEAVEGPFKLIPHEFSPHGLKA